MTQCLYSDGSLSRRLEGALRGSNRVHDLITLAIFINDTVYTVIQCTAHDRGVTNAVTVGLNDKR